MPERAADMAALFYKSHSPQQNYACIDFNFNYGANSQFLLKVTGDQASLRTRQLLCALNRRNELSANISFF
jgi:hypothetical protein